MKSISVKLIDISDSETYLLTVIALWSNGRTVDSGSTNSGSNPDKAIYNFGLLVELVDTRGLSPRGDFPRAGSTPA